MPFVGLASAAIGACWYSHLSHVIGFFTFSGKLAAVAAVLRMLACLPLALAVAIPVALAGLPLKVRSTLAMRLHGAMAGLAAIYFAWVFDVWLLWQETAPGTDLHQLWHVAHSPSVIWDMAAALAVSREVFDLRVAASVMWTLWSLEALLVVALCVWLAPRVVRARSFCEPCRRWLVPIDSIRLSADLIADFRVRREGLASLVHAAVAAPAAGTWFWLRRWRCPTCAASEVFRVDKVLSLSVRKAMALASSEVAKTAIPLVPLAKASQADQALLRDLERAAAVAAARDA